jgi:hypothetical protein
VTAWNRYQGATPNDAALLIVEDLAGLMSKSTVLDDMCRSGWQRDEAAHLIEGVSSQVQSTLEGKFRGQMLKYGAFAAVGFLLSLGTYVQAVMAGGGRYFIAWGAVVFGLYYCYKGYSAWAEYRSLSRESVVEPTHRTHYDGAARQLPETRAVRPYDTSVAQNLTEGERQTQHWLQLLRDGTEAQKYEARFNLSYDFERLGKLDDAIDILSKNFRADIRDENLLLRLGTLYRKAGYEAAADAAFAEDGPGLVAAADWRPRQTLVEEEGRVVCRQCGYASSSSRKTCKGCRQPIRP